MKNNYIIIFLFSIIFLITLLGLIQREDTFSVPYQWKYSIDDSELKRELFLTLPKNKTLNEITNIRIVNGNSYFDISKDNLLYTNNGIKLVLKDFNLIRDNTKIIAKGDSHSLITYLFNMAFNGYN